MSVMEKINNTNPLAIMADSISSSDKYTSNCQLSHDPETTFDHLEAVLENPERFLPKKFYLGMMGNIASTVYQHNPDDDNTPLLFNRFAEAIDQHLPKNVEFSPENEHDRKIAKGIAGAVLFFESHEKQALKHPEAALSAYIQIEKMTEFAKVA